MGSVQLRIERGAVVAFEDLPPNFAALDGYSRGPALDPANRRFSFDHHENCVRLATRATCEQALDAILLGLEVEGLTIGINDIDEDTALATWLLLRPAMAGDDHVQRVMQVMGLLDAHGPAYPLTAAQQKIHQQARSVFDPLYQEYQNGTYGSCDFDTLLQTLLERLDRWLVDGEVFPPSEEAPIEWRVYYEDDQWAVIEANVTVMDIVYQHRPRGVSFTKQKDGSIAYTIGRRSDLVPNFDVEIILSRLADIEPGWGGGSSIGGAPRNPDGSRSRLKPDEVINIVRGVIGEN